MFIFVKNLKPWLHQIKLKILIPASTNLGTIFDIDAKLIEIQNEEEQTFDPNFWNNPKDAEATMKTLRVKKKWVQDYKDLKTLIEDLEVIYDFFKEEEATLQDVENRYNKAATLLEDISKFNIFK